MRYGRLTNPRQFLSGDLCYSSWIRWGEVVGEWGTEHGTTTSAGSNMPLACDGGAIVAIVAIEAIEAIEAIGTIGAIETIGPTGGGGDALVGIIWIWGWISFLLFFLSVIFLGRVSFWVGGGGGLARYGKGCRV